MNSPLVENMEEKDEILNPMSSDMELSEEGNITTI